MLCDQCCDSKNVKKLIEANGQRLEDKTNCVRCSGMASWSISSESFIEALGNIVTNRYVLAEGPPDYFGSLELSQAEKYRNAWNEYEGLEAKFQNELYHEDEEDDENLFEKITEKSFKDQEYIAEKHGVDFDDVQNEFYNGLGLYNKADTVINQALNLSHSSCIDRVKALIPDLSYEESRFFYALNHPEEEIYWKTKPRQVITEANDTLWDEYVNITRTESRFFIERNKRANEILKVFDEIIKASQNLYYGGQEVYRARIASTSNAETIIESNPAKELNNAPVNFATYNRFSPAGISYAYASFDEETAVEEIRPNNTDIVYIGTYKLEDKKYIDFSNSMIERCCNDLDPFYKEVIAHNIEFVSSFIENVRKPISSDHQKIDYVPTQILSEYINLNDYQGIIFDSSITGKKNVVYFGALNNYKDYRKVQVKLLTTYK